MIRKKRNCYHTVEPRSVIVPLWLRGGAGKELIRLCKNGEDNLQQIRIQPLTETLDLGFIPLQTQSQMRATVILTASNKSAWVDCFISNRFLAFVISSSTPLSHDVTGGHIGVPKGCNGGHLGCYKPILWELKSSLMQTLLFLFQLICTDAGKVSENAL